MRYRYTGGGKYVQIGGETDARINTNISDYHRRKTRKARTCGRKEIQWQFYAAVPAAAVASPGQGQSMHHQVAHDSLVRVHRDHTLQPQLFEAWCNLIEFLFVLSRAILPAHSLLRIHILVFGCNGGGQITAGKVRLARWRPYNEDPCFRKGEGEDNKDGRLLEDNLVCSVHACQRALRVF